MFDLLSTVEYGGCSAKMAPDALKGLLETIPLLRDNNVMVDIDTHDDAGVYRISDDMALIITTDFFPPVCSSPEMFGEIAATNALSDVYAMGGTPLLSLNITMFPTTKVDPQILCDILRGGQIKVNEAGAFTMGGHTIDDPTPKYGLAVVGTVHPDRLITNMGAHVGQVLILTKPLGTGVMMAAHRMGIADEAAYQTTLEQMRLLNKEGARLMQHYGVRGATDVTGFGLLGHAMQMANASSVTFEINTASLPLIDTVEELLGDGCIPGAAFRNLRYVEASIFANLTVTTEEKMAACDAQTSGGLLMAVDADKATALLADLHATGVHPQAAIIGRVIPQANKAVHLIHE